MHLVQDQSPSVVVVTLTDGNTAPIKSYKMTQVLKIEIATGKFIVGVSMHLIIRINEEYIFNLICYIEKALNRVNKEFSTFTIACWAFKCRNVRSTFTWIKTSWTCATEQEILLKLSSLSLTLQELADR